jgi:Rod binding domain-containing protein
MDINHLKLQTAVVGTDSKPQEAEKMARALLGAGNNQKDPSEIHKAVKEFEGYFISYLMTEMRNTIKPGLLQNKEGKQFYSFYDQEIGRLAAESGGLGLAAMLERSLTQEPQPSGPTATQVSPHAADKTYEWERSIPH